MWSAGSNQTGTCPPWNFWVWIRVSTVASNGGSARSSGTTRSTMRQSYQVWDRSSSGENVPVNPAAAPSVVIERISPVALWPFPRNSSNRCLCLNSIGSPSKERPSTH